MACAAIGNDACHDLQRGLGSVATIVLIVVAILLSLKVAVFVTGLICTAACGVALLCCCACAIDSCDKNR